MSLGEKKRSSPKAIEALPTLFVAVAIHGGWLAMTWWHAALPLPLLVLFGGAIVAWHGSLQHETIHGHPTGRRVIDDAIGFAPLALWLPYPIYRATHLAHHRTPAITDPAHDPESHYRANAGAVTITLARLEAPLVGRLVFGPPLRIGRFLVGEAARAWRSPAAWARDWLPHLAALVPVLWWLDRVGLPLGTYLLAFVYPGTALTLLRSFAEHRADPLRTRRSAIVERGGPLALLFLNNNLHAVHHARPDLPWHRLPAFHRRHRAAFADAPRYRGYGEIVRRFAWTPQDDVIHPDHRAPA